MLPVVPPIYLWSSMSDNQSPRAFSPTRRMFLSVLAISPAIAGCSSVGVFNSVVPSDARGLQVGADIPFGSDPRQQLDIYAPADANGLPSVLFIYGGSWKNGSRKDYAFAGRAIAARGYVVAVADYRLVPQVLYPDFVVDGALAVKWMGANIGRYGGNPRNLFVVGHSAGAYNAVMIALDPGIRARAGLRSNILRGAVGLAGPYDFLPLDDDATISAFSEWPDPKDTQPIYHVSASAPPMFLGHGADDTTVYPKNTKSLATKLRVAGAQVEEKYYAGIGHAGILTALAPPLQGNAPVLDDLDRFLKQHSR